MAEDMNAIVSVLDRPYMDRQLIVVTDDEIVQAARSAELQVLEEKAGVNWAKIGEITVRILLGGTGRILAEVTMEALQAWRRARESGINILAVGKSEAAVISFPPGHPREGVLYIGHPASPNVYYTTAEFHRVTFEHKFSEAIDLLMSLGATKVRVEHVTGWSKEFSSRLSVPLGDIGSSVDVHADSSRSEGTTLLYEATLDGTTDPKVPENLVWYPQLLAQRQLRR